MVNRDLSGFRYNRTLLTGMTHAAFVVLLAPTVRSTPRGIRVGRYIAHAGLFEGCHRQTVAHLFHNNNGPTVGRKNIFFDYRGIASATVGLSESHFDYIKIVDGTGSRPRPVASSIASTWFASNGPQIGSPTNARMVSRYRHANSCASTTTRAVGGSANC